LLLWKFFFAPKKPSRPTDFRESVTAIVRNDPESAAAGNCRVEIIEPLNLAKHQSRGGYILDNRQVQMTCAKSAGVHLGDEIRARVVWIFHSAQILLFGAEFTQVCANTYGSQVEPKEHAPKMENKEIEVPSDRESHESASRVKIANGKGADSAPMR
jgi:hypothetical protein